MDELKIFINNTRDLIDVICIQETWYKENHKPYNLKGYREQSKTSDKITQTEVGVFM